MSKHLFFQYRKVVGILSFLVGIISISPYTTRAQWSVVGNFPDSFKFNNTTPFYTKDNNDNLYLGGYRKSNGNYSVSVAKWDGNTWSELGPLGASIKCLATDKFGNLYAAGSFRNSQGFFYVAKWDGSKWSEVGGANTSRFTSWVSDGIQSLVTDAAGNVYAAGTFGLDYTFSQGVVAKWDGSTWTYLEGGYNFSKQISKIAIDSFGNLYAVGPFINNGGGYRVMKWNGTAWSQVGGTNDSTFQTQIRNLTTDAIGNLYAETYTGFGSYIAKWNGSSWTKLGNTNSKLLNGGGGLLGYVTSIFADATGNLYAGGGFYNDSNGTYNIAIWNGSNWSEFGGYKTNLDNIYLSNGKSGKLYAVGHYYDGSSNEYVAKLSDAIAPIISSFTPKNAPKGTTVTIKGKGFTWATSVSFGGTSAISFTVLNDSVITAVVGSGASGNVKVTTSVGTENLAGFTFIPSPTITSFTPTIGTIGTTVTISGINFTGATSVTFGGISASSFTVVDVTTIKAVVGSGATGNISVTTPGGTASLAGFTNPQPFIKSFYPLATLPDSTVTIRGSNFNGTTQVSFGGIAARSFTVLNDSTITAIVGSGASGSVKLVNSFGSGSLAGFEMSFPPNISYQSNSFSIANSSITPTNTGGAVDTKSIFKTLAGQSNSSGYVDGNGIDARFSSPNGVAVDNMGNVYVADMSNSMIRKVTPSGFVTTIANCNSPFGIAIDPGNQFLVVAGGGYNSIYKVTLSGQVTTLAGSGQIGSTDGLADQASFNFPTGVAVDASGNVYVADRGNNKIRKIGINGIVSTIAGDGTQNSIDGVGTSASLDNPRSLIIDSIGNIYFIEESRNLRNISQSGLVSTIIKNIGGFNIALGKSGCLYVADIGNIIKVSTSGVQTNLSGISDSLGWNWGIALDTDENIYLCDWSNRIAKVSNYGYSITPTLPSGLQINDITGVVSGVSTLPSSNKTYSITAWNKFGKSSTAIEIPSSPKILSFSPVNALNGATVTIKGSNFIWVSSVSFGSELASSFTVLNDSTITAVVGTGSSGNVTVSSIGGTSSKAGFKHLNAPNFSYSSVPNEFTVRQAISPISPTNSGGSVATKSIYKTLERYRSSQGVAVDTLGNVYVADQGNDRIRKITPSGVITILASGFQARGVAIDPTNQFLVVAGFSSRVVYKVTLAGVVSILAGDPNGAQGSSDGPASTATFVIPDAVTVDANGNVFVADREGNKIRKIDTNGMVTTVAGDGVQETLDGNGTSARLDNPCAIAIDSFGNIYISEYGIGNLRKITPSGDVSTIGNYSWATGLAIGKSNCLYANSYSNIYKINFLGTKISEIQCDSSFTGGGICVDQLENIYLAGAFSGITSKLSNHGYWVSPPLPSGLQLNTVNGIISGTPTVATPNTAYTITAWNESGKSSTTINFATKLPPAPSITSFTPTTAPKGSTVTIKGNTFTTATAVSFGGTAASSFTVVNDSVITAVLGNGASGDVKVTISNGESDSLAGFTYYCATIYTPTFTISGTNPVCEGANTTISLINYNNSDTSAGSSPSFQWYRNGNEIYGETNSSINYDAYSWNNGDVITLNVTNNTSGCLSQKTFTSNTFTQVVNPSITPTITAQINGSDTCGSSANLSCSVTNTSTANLTYEWYNYDNWDYLIIYGSPIATGQSFNYTVGTINNGYNGSTNYYQCKVSGFQGCVSASSTTSNVVSQNVNYTIVNPSFGITASATGFPYGTPVTFTATSTDTTFGGWSYSWVKSGQYVGSGSTYIDSTLTNNELVECRATYYTKNSCIRTGYYPDDYFNIQSISVSVCNQPSSMKLSSATNCFGTASLGFLPSLTNYYSSSNVTPSFFLNGNPLVITNEYFGYYFADYSQFKNGDIVTCTIIPDNPCTPNFKLKDSIVISGIIPLINPTFGSLQATKTSLTCSEPVTFNLPLLSGTANKYYWYKNGILSSGANDSTNTYTDSTLKNGDKIYCRAYNTNLICNSFYNSDTITIQSTGATVLIPTINIATLQSGVLCEGSEISFVATVTNAGASPTYNWKKNGVLIATSDTPYYKSSTLKNSDIISCSLTSNAPCALPATVNSNNINLLIKVPSSSITTISNCGNYSWNGVTYTTSGTYTKSLVNAAGCDSVATLNLTINTPTASTTTVSNCGSYTWNGVTYTTSGTYTKTFTGGNSKGCDSVATLNLTINSATASTTTVSNCGSYTWNGVTYTTSGTYTKTYAGGNSKGCDSVATLNLTINTPTASTTTVSNCGSYTWNGVTYTTSGTYTKTFTGGNSKGCDSVATLNLTITSCLPNYTWTGSTNANWSLASNWSNSVLPTSSNAVTIPSSASNQPQLSTNTTIGAIVLNGQLDLNGKTITLTGAVSGTGTFKTDANASLVVNGNVGSLNFDAANNTIKYVTITSGSATLGSSLNVVGVFTPTAGTFNTGNYLTLKSTSISNTAVVGVVGGSVTGKVTVERYIPKGVKAFRQLCTGGVYNTGSIFDNWQESGARPSGYGMYVFGKKGTTWSVDASGLDVTDSGAASMFDYTGYLQYTPILNTKTTQLDPYKGYYGVVYGDRTANTFSNFDASTSMNAATTIRTTGSLVTGTVTFSTNGVVGNYNSNVTKLFPLADTGTLIANPYAAPIDWHTVTKTNMSKSYWYVDPTFLNSKYQVPVAYNAVAGTNSNTNSKIGQYIQPGQGFWVFTDATNNSTREIIFHESDKAINATKSAVFGSANKPNRISIGIWKAGKNLDGAVAVFKNGFSKAYQAEDSKKLYSNGENLFIQEANRALCIDGLPMPQNNDVINLQFSNLKKDSSYQLKLDATEFSSTGIKAYLEDNLLKKQTAITDSTIVNFTATNNASYQNRFTILFKPTTPLAVQFISLKGQLVESNIDIQFTTANEVNMANYTIEKSVNGTDFKAVNVQVAQNTNAANYNWLDKQVSADVNYYRIKAIEVNGTTSYSKTIVVNKQVVKGAITIFPNPIKDRSFNVLMSNVPVGNYQLNVYDIAGKLVMQTSINHSSEATNQSVSLKQALAKGSYLVKLSNDAGSVYQTKLVVE